MLRLECPLLKMPWPCLSIYLAARLAEPPRPDPESHRHLSPGTGYLELQHSPVSRPYQEWLLGGCSLRPAHRLDLPRPAKSTSC